MAKHPLLLVVALACSMLASSAQPSGFHEIPNPHPSVSGINQNDAGENRPSRIAQKWRPRGAPQEPLVSTYSRFAGRLIDRDTGRAYSADELATQSALAGKQDALVSGDNLKTVNGSSLLGGGDLTVSGGGSSNSAQRLYWTLKRLENDRQTSYPLVLRILTIGDSWSTDASAGLVSAFGAYGQVTPAGSAILGGSASLAAAYSNYPLSPWGGQTITLSTNISSHATFGKFGGGATTRLDPIRYAVVFYEGMSGASFTVQYEDLAGAWQPLATVATDSVASSGLQVWESSALPYSMATRIRVVWASGSPRICAAGGSNSTGNAPQLTSTRTGVVTCNLGTGGSTMAQMASTSQASWNALLGWLKPDIVFFREKPEVSIGSWSPDFDQLRTRIRTARPETDFVFIGRHLTGDGTESQNASIDAYYQTLAGNANNAATFVDIMSYMPSSLAQARTLGINRTSDAVHTDRYGDVMIADIVHQHLWSSLGRFVNSTIGAIPYAPRMMGRGFQVDNGMPLYFDGSLSSGMGGFQIIDECGGNTGNHKARLGLVQAGFGWTGAGTYNEGVSLTDSGQSFVRWDGAKRVVFGNTAVVHAITRNLTGRLEVNTGATNIPGLVITSPSGQTSNFFEAYTSTTSSSVGTLATRMDASGNLRFEVAGLGLALKTGSNARIGTGAQLSSGTVTVANTSVTANTHVSLTKTAHSGTGGTSYVVTKSAGTSFTITSIDASGATVTTDASTFDWVLTERQ